MPTIRWLGSAQDIQQEDECEFTGTWATGDTVSFQINNKDLTLTVGAAVTPADVANAAKAMFLASNPFTGLIGTESRNFGGQAIAEFQELDTTPGAVSVSSATLTLKWTAGIPVTINVTQTTAGNGAINAATDGVFQAVTPTTAATGKNFFNNADNWSGGALPNGGDTIVFDQGAVDVLYGLNDNTGTDIEDLNLIRTNGYTGNIGLLPVHPTLGYIQYRTQYLNLANTTASQNHQIGDLDSTRTPVGRTFLDLGLAGTATAINVAVYDAPQRDAITGYPVRLKRGDVINLTVHSGGVSLGSDLTVANSEINSVVVYGDGQVLLDDAAQFETNATVAVHGGDLTIQCDAGTNVTATVHGGAATIYTALATLNCRGGTSMVSGVTITTATVHPGATLSEGIVAATFTNITAYPGSSVKHPKDLFTFTNGLDVSGGKVTSITWDSPSHKTYTLSAI